jgi:acyl-homoserine-lactone acylase
VNEYAQRHGDTIDPSFQPILPFLPTDVTAGIQNTVHFHFMPAQDNIPTLISFWQSGGSQVANAVACSFTPGCPTGTAVAANMTHGGSNGWAISANNSASGNAILMGNPHLPWGNNALLPVSKGLGMGAPFIGIGYSDKVGWTHTDNTIQNTNLYELTLSSDGKTYMFGGIPMPLQCTPASIQVRQAPAPFPFTICSSVHGPSSPKTGIRHSRFVSPASTSPPSSRNIGI